MVRFLMSAGRLNALMNTAISTTKYVVHDITNVRYSGPGAGVVGFKKPTGEHQDDGKRHQRHPYPPAIRFLHRQPG